MIRKKKSLEGTPNSMKTRDTKIKTSEPNIKVNHKIIQSLSWIVQFL